jgi:hypothetical protein
LEAIYDREGRAVAWRRRDAIHDAEGRLRAFIHDHAVFTYAGEYLGRYEDGFYRDARGAAVAFEDGATGGPLPPPTIERDAIAPVPELPRPAPTVTAPPPPPIRPRRWSDTGWEAFLRGPVEAS